MRGWLSDQMSEEYWIKQSQTILFTIELLSAFNMLW